MNDQERIPPRDDQAKPLTPGPNTRSQRREILFP